jgi:hypothetical protein
VSRALRPSELARQRASVRAVNERVDPEVVEGAGEYVPIQCECGGDDCTTVIDLHSDVYRGIRQHPGWFIVAEGHHAPEIGRVEQHRGTFTIVESTYSGLDTALA